MDIRIRLSTPADQKFVHDLCISTAAANMSSLRPAPLVMVEASCERLIDLICGTTHTTFIAEADGVRAGFLLFIDQLPDEITGLRQAFIPYTAVLPDFRGKGVGRQLLAAAETEARNRGLQHIALMVTDENRPARKLYESVGYHSERRLLCKIL